MRLLLADTYLLLHKQKISQFFSVFLLNSSKVGSFSNVLRLDERAESLLPSALEFSNCSKISEHGWNGSASPRSSVDCFLLSPGRDILMTFESLFGKSVLSQSKFSSKVVRRFVDIVLITAFFFGDFSTRPYSYTN